MKFAFGAIAIISNGELDDKVTQSVLRSKKPVIPSTIKASDLPVLPELVALLIAVLQMIEEKAEMIFLFWQQVQ